MNKQMVLWIAAFGVLAMLYANLNSQKAAEIKEVTPAEFKNYLKEKNLEELLFGKVKVTGKVKNPAGSLKRVHTKPVTFHELEEIRLLAEKNDIPYRSAPDTDWLWQIAWFFLQLILWMLLLMWLLGSQLRGATDFMKTRARKYIGLGQKVTFTDVVGCDEAKEELRDIVEFLKDPKRFNKLGGKIPRGVLLVGEPGTGKTLLARATANEAGVAFLSASGSEFIEMFVGVGAGRVRSLFEEARKSAPCIVFIDELDAVGGRRGNYVGHGEHNQTINEFLKQLDGFDKIFGVIVIAATNKVEVLDPALIRPGRFDRHIHVPLPDVKGREAILRLYAKDKPMAPDVNFREIAKDTAGMAGADLANLMNEAALMAAKSGKEQIEQSDLSEAADKIAMGPARKSLELSGEVEEIIAYHEAGHTLVGKLLKDKGAYSVQKVTITPRGQALGLTKYLPETDLHLYSQEQLEAMVKISVGGRAAEEVRFGKVTTGAHNDFEKASEILRAMVMKFGMSEAGLVIYSEIQDPWGRSSGINASEKTKERLEIIVDKMMYDLYSEVRELLTVNKEKLTALAQALLVKKTLLSDEIDQIINSA